MLERCFSGSPTTCPLSLPWIWIWISILDPRFGPTQLSLLLPGWMLFSFYFLLLLTLSIWQIPSRILWVFFFCCFAAGILDEWIRPFFQKASNIFMLITTLFLFYFFGWYFFSDFVFHDIMYLLLLYQGFNVTKWIIIIILLFSDNILIEFELL